MKELARMMSDLGNRLGKEGYYLLYLAVKEAVKIQPRTPNMNELCKKVMVQAGKRKIGTVYRALSRVSDDIWDGKESRKALAKYCRHNVVERLTAKELVTALSRYLWEEVGAAVEGPSMSYCVFTSAYPKGYGILVYGPDDQFYASTGPFSTDRGWIERVVRFLNRQNVSFEEFEELFMSGNFLIAINDVK